MTFSQVKLSVTFNHGHQNWHEGAKSKDWIMLVWYSSCESSSAMVLLRRCRKTGWQDRYWSWCWCWWLFPRTGGLGARHDQLFPACVFWFYFIWVEISLCAPVPLFKVGSVYQGLSELRRLWTSIPWWVVCELISLICLDSIVNQLQLCWIRAHAYLGVTCYLHFWQNDWGLFPATAVTQGWNV